MKTKTDIRISLVGQDGNAFFILARCRAKLRENNMLDLWNDFHKEATSGDYNHLLATVMAWFIVE